MRQLPGRSSRIANPARKRVIVAPISAMLDKAQARLDHLMACKRGRTVPLTLGRR